MNRNDCGIGHRAVIRVHRQAHRLSQPLTGKQRQRTAGNGNRHSDRSKGEGAQATTGEERGTQGASPFALRTRRSSLRRGRRRPRLPCLLARCGGRAEGHPRVLWPLHRTVVCAVFACLCVSRLGPRAVAAWIVRRLFVCVCACVPSERGPKALAQRPNLGQLA
jgi:hypothetical protein